jgi:hypothetical protein
MRDEQEAEDTPQPSGSTPGYAPVTPLSERSVDPLHRGDHADPQQADQQDQADVPDRPLAALAGERAGVDVEERYRSPPVGIG